MRNLAYSRLETDEEFKARVIKELGRDKTCWYEKELKEYRGDKLDGFMWGYFNRQRKIIKIYP